MDKSSIVKRQTPELILAAVFFILILIGISHHEMWVDEARPWLIAKFTDWNSLAYAAKIESHPVLWYAIVKIAASIFDNPIILQLISAAFGLIAFLAILFYSPFSRLEKLLLTTNLYLFFEYTIVARNYSLEIAALFVLCALFVHRRQHFAAYLVVCGILAQSHFYGFLWSILFILLLFFEGGPRVRELNKPKVWLAALFYTTCAAATTWVLVRESEQLVLAHTLKFVSNLNVRAIAKTLLLGLFPVVNPETIYVTVTAPSMSFDTYATLLFLATLGLIIYLLRKNHLALGIFVSMTFTFIAISAFRQNEAFPPRHMGQLTLIILVTLWIGKVNLQNKFLRSIIFVLFATQALAGLYMYIQDYRLPFSNGKNAANWLRQTDLPQGHIIADGSFYSASFLGYLDDTTIYNSFTHEKIYYWRINQEELRYIKIRPVAGSFPIVHTREEVLYKLIKKIKCEKREEPLFIANYPANFFNWSDVHLELVQAFTGSLRAKEDFYIYRVVSDVTRLCNVKI